LLANTGSGFIKYSGIMNITKNPIAGVIDPRVKNMIAAIASKITMPIAFSRLNKVI
jgi:hypothetical protein